MEEAKMKSGYEEGSSQLSVSEPCGSSARWVQEQLEGCIREGSWAKVESMLNAELRHRSGSQPLDYLRHWLKLFRPLGYATHDDSWGELEKEIVIAVRHYYEMRDQLAEITALVDGCEEWLQAVEVGDNPDGYQAAQKAAYLRGALGQIKFRATHRRDFPRK